jgi:sugar phosphate isomerase/epimerase
MNRRSFLKTTALSATAASLPIAASQAAHHKSEPLFKVSLAQWSLNKHFFAREGYSKLDNLDFAKTARSFGIDAIEYVNQMFKTKAKDKAYIKEMIKRADGEGVKSLLIMVDGEGLLGDPDTAKRKQTVENHLKWLDAAKTLGCHSIRVNAGSKGSYKEQQKLAADGLRKLSEAGDKRGINVLVENHGGFSSNGKWLSGVMDMVDHDRCGTLPDFGNFIIDRNTGERYDIYQGMEDLMPHAKAVSAKAYGWAVDPDPNVCVSKREGRETTLDFKRCIEIALKHGYRGYIGIEYEGSYQTPMQGVAMTKAAMDRILLELS